MCSSVTPQAAAANSLSASALGLELPRPPPRGTTQCGSDLEHWYPAPASMHPLVVVGTATV